MRPERMTPARERVLETADNGLSWTRSGLAHAAGVSSSVIDGLTAQGVFETVFMPRRRGGKPDPDYAEHRLSRPQKQAADRDLREGRCRRVRRVADRRRHRFGQDGGLFRGDCR
jgi:primosomal protein N' (replication factor Y)